MKVRVLSLLGTILALSALGPTAAIAADLRNGDGSTAVTFQSWVDNAALPAPNVVATVGWSDTACPFEKIACTSAGSPIWINSTMVPAWRRGPQIDRRETFLHELGHQVDYLPTTTDADRAAFLALRYLDGRPWREAPNSPHEQFAEAWGYCSVYGMTPPTMLGYRNHQFQPFVTNAAYLFDPSPARYRRICRLLADISIRSWSPATASPET